MQCKVTRLVEHTVQVITGCGRDQVDNTFRDHVAGPVTHFHRREGPAYGYSSLVPGQSCSQAEKGSRKDGSGERRSHCAGVCLLRVQRWEWCCRLEAGKRLQRRTLRRQPAQGYPIAFYYSSEVSFSRDWNIIADRVRRAGMYTRDNPKTERRTACSRVKTR